MDKYCLIIYSLIALVYTNICWHQRYFIKLSGKKTFKTPILPDIREETKLFTALSRQMTFRSFTSLNKRILLLHFSRRILYFYSIIHAHYSAVTSAETSETSSAAVSRVSTTESPDDVTIPVSELASPAMP